MWNSNLRSINKDLEMFIDDLDLRFILSSFMCDDLSLKDFEQILYSNILDLEDKLGKENYLKLISLDFNKTSIFEIKKSIYDLSLDSIYYDKSIYFCAKFKLNLISLKDVFNYLDVINDEISLNYSNENSDIYMSALGIDTTGYSSEINRLGEDAYRNGAVKEIEKLIDHIDKNHTVIDYFKRKLISDM